MTDKKNFLATMAIGDSYGMKYEFAVHATDKTADDLFHGPHPKFTEYPVGHYTDDTQMSLANLELLMSGSELTAQAFAEKWLEAFKRDPHHGYSRHMWKVLSESETADDFVASLDPSRGVTSGAAMRAGPFGLLSDIAEVKRLTELQARITHDTVAGVNAALAVALSVHYLHHGGARGGLDAFLASHIGADWNSAEKGYTEDTSNGLNIVTQALDAVKKANSLSGVLLNVVNHKEKSDTDTIAAIAMVIASRCNDLPDDLPQTLRDGVENGAYGRDYLAEVDKKAAAFFPATEIYAVRPVIKASAPPPAARPPSRG